MPVLCTLHRADFQRNVEIAMSAYSDQSWYHSMEFYRVSLQAKHYLFALVCCIVKRKLYLTAPRLAHNSSISSDLTSAEEYINHAVGICLPAHSLLLPVAPGEAEALPSKFQVLRLISSCVHSGPYPNLVQEVSSTPYILTVSMKSAC